MRAFFRPLFTWFLHLGGFGLVILGILDSSFLVLPFGNDILLTVLVAQNHTWMPLYVALAAIGSTLGVVLLDRVVRKGGEEGLKKILSPQRFELMKKKMSTRAGAALTLACVAPPPFPFSAVVAAASAFQYSRKKLLAIVLGARALRFAIVGSLALWWGRRVIRIIRSPEFTWFMVGFIALCVVLSTISVLRWIRRGKGPRPSYSRPAHGEAA